MLFPRMNRNNNVRNVRKSARKTVQPQVAANEQYKHGNTVYQYCIKRLYSKFKILFKLDLGGRLVFGMSVFVTQLSSEPVSHRILVADSVKP